MVSLLVCLGACDSSSTNCDFFCDTYQPSFGLLAIDVVINDENPAIPIKVYFDRFEPGQNELYFVDTLTTEEVAYEVILDQYYSAVAKYVKNGDTILVVDGDRVDLQIQNCEFICYEVDNGNLDLELER